MSTLAEIRKEAGYRSARAFAEELGVPTATYSRYELTPDKIPMQAAWRIADFLGCPIDTVVGRAAPLADNQRGEVQRWYDNLSSDSQRLFNEFRQFIGFREESVQRRLEAEEDERYRRYARHYERLFMQSADTGTELADVVIFGSPEQRRAAFREFLEQRVAQRRASEADLPQPEDADPEERAQRDRDVIDRILEAYDEMAGEERPRAAAPDPYFVR